jgi:hypothetical protein
MAIEGAPVRMSAVKKLNSCRLLDGDFRTFSNFLKRIARPQIDGKAAKYEEVNAITFFRE